MSKADPNTPRLLTHEEMTYIIAQCFNDPDNPNPVKEAADVPKLAANKLRKTMYDNNVNLIYIQLSEIVITPLAINDLIAILRRTYQRAMIDSESPVGILAGESLGGPITQMTLRSFHQSGSSKTVGAGIDNLRALVTMASNKYPSCIIHYENKQMTIEDVVQTRKDIVSLTMSEIVLDYDIDTDSNVKEEDKWWYDAYLELYPDKLAGTRLANEVTAWYMRLELDSKKMYTYGISTDMIMKTVERAVGIHFLGDEL